MAEAKTKEAAGGEDQSMEEILQSIRKIIAEEGDEPNIESADENEMPDSVLELTDAVQDDGSVVNVADEEGDVLNEIDDALEKPEPEPEPEPEPAPKAKPEPVERDPLPEPVAIEAGDDDDGLVSTASIAASAAALNALKKTGDLGALPFASGNTVEGLVQQLLRPMLKEWLDTNLPDIVQKTVEREVRRISSEK